MSSLQHGRVLHLSTFTLPASTFPSATFTAVNRAANTLPSQGIASGHNVAHARVAKTMFAVYITVALGSVIGMLGMWWIAWLAYRLWYQLYGYGTATRRWSAVLWVWKTMSRICVKVPIRTTNCPYNNFRGFWCRVQTISETRIIRCTGGVATRKRKQSRLTIRRYETWRKIEHIHFAHTM